MRNSLLPVALWTLAGLVPLVVVAYGNLAFWRLVGHPERFAEEMDVLPMQALLAALPFLVLARAGSKGAAASPPAAFAAAALAGLAVTLPLWGLYYYDGYRYWKYHLSGGANIGLGWLMLASPLLAGIAMHAAFRRVSRAREAGRKPGDPGQEAGR
ncbi:MAG: hypothetical protein FIB01_01740 [Gemmatimonadetes bacterium]|nr:hypothetical protein [Gemmatimonadota bacterium]